MAIRDLKRMLDPQGWVQVGVGNFYQSIGQVCIHIGLDGTYAVWQENQYGLDELPEEAFNGY